MANAMYRRRMRLEHTHLTERFGAVRIHELQRVIELDSGGSGEYHPTGHGRTSEIVPADAIRAVERELVIVIPCKNEARRVIEGVLSGIPHDCLIVLVSNSGRGPVDRYEIEAQTVAEYCRLAERPALTIHQRDPGLAAALKVAGAPEIIDEDGLVRNGKGEGMLVGMALAALTGRRYVVYVDADNYVPGSINEYCKAFAAGLHLADSPYAMVRISWHSKPKLQEGRLYFSRRGRASEVTNHFLNLLIAEHSGFGTDVIATGNAGEHALTLDLGRRMRMAGGFAVEPYQYVDLFEQFGGVGDSLHPDVMASSVGVRQIETRNPHFHDNKGEGHVKDMRLQALNVLYHSSVCLPPVREAIREFLTAQDALAPAAEPPRERVYPPVGALALDQLLDVLASEARTFRQIVRCLPEGLRTDPPIRRADIGLGVDGPGR